MYYIIQENVFKEKHFNTLIDTLDRYKIEYEVVRWRPFAEDIDFITNRKDVFCFGCVNLTKAAHKYNWSPGVYFNEGHDMEVYMKYYKDHMLNADGTCININDSLPSHLPDIFFARPTKDSKLFTGSLFSREEWQEWVSDNTMEPHTRVFVASPKNYIQKEIRCWIVDKKVVTISLYKLGSKGFQQNYDHEQEAIDFAQSMVNIYSPSRAFVLDICLYDGQYKVVEINCLNCAGYYEANMSKLIQALETMVYDDIDYQTKQGEDLK